MKRISENGKEGGSSMRNGQDPTDDIGRIIGHAGAREAVPAERADRAREIVRRHWQQELARRAKPRRNAWLGLAAGVLLASGMVSLWMLSGGPGTNVVASVDRVLGEVTVAGTNRMPGESNQRDAIEAGSRIVTGPESRIALRMSGGQSLRVDIDSTVTLVSANQLSLERGALYIDTDQSTDPGPVFVSTPLGIARDIGTQFQVRLTNSALSVSVREGKVIVAPPGRDDMAVDEGQQLAVNVSGRHTRQSLSFNDAGWQWIETIMPEFSIDGASLQQYLDWFAHERGLVLVWADRISQDNADLALLSGSITGLGLDDSLLVVKGIAPFNHRIDGQTLWVEVN